jgi:hypothetical protein
MNYNRHWLYRQVVLHREKEVYDRSADDLRSK